MAEETKMRMGGSFAPPLDLKRLEHYRGLAEKAPRPVEDAMMGLCSMVETFLTVKEAGYAKTAEKHNGKPHPSGIGYIIPLSQDSISALDFDVPYAHECNAYQSLFDALPDGLQETQYYEPSNEFADRQIRTKQAVTVANQEAKDLRDAAFHLLWFAKELEMDRVPMTNDMLPENMRPLAVDENSPVTVRLLGKKAHIKSKPAKAKGRSKKGR